MLRGMRLDMRCQVKVHGERRQDWLRTTALVQEGISVHELCSRVIEDWIDDQLAKLAANEPVAEAEVA